MRRAGEWSTWRGSSGSRDLVVIGGRHATPHNSCLNRGMGRFLRILLRPVPPARLAQRTRFAFAGDPGRGGRAVRGGGLDRRGDMGIAAMALEVDEERVAPVVDPRRSLVDVREVHAGIAELGEDVDEGARSVVGLELDRGAIVAGGSRLLPADDEEPRDVLGAILDAIEEHLHPVDLPAQSAADRRRPSARSPPAGRRPRCWWSR